MATAFDDLGQVVPGVRVGWESSNPGGVPVDQGVVTVNSVDTVTVTAWLLDYPDVRDTVTILVEQEPCDIVVVPPVIILAIGERWQIVVSDCNGYPIEPPAVTFSSSNPNVVSVDENGFVTVIGPGVAIITVTVAGRSFIASVGIN